MTKLQSSLAVVLIGCALIPRTAQARWNSKEDNKSEETLVAMTDKDLFNEAFDVCVRRAMVERQDTDTPGLVETVTTDAADYLSVIYQVAGKNHGGSAPSGMRELTEAHTVKKCQAAFRTFLASQEPHAPHPTKRAVPHVAKKTPPTHHGDPLEQLPPWLAPRQP